ncbi:MAG: Ig-like domain-containing protein [Tannerellaceae bacterium]|jgi:uncharacterized protein YjdB|nr:Ig-like domain-containing protein [Tannerellaceae bacterium]
MKRIQILLIALLLGAGLCAQQQIPQSTFQVQGHPRPDLQSQTDIGTWALTGQSRLRAAQNFTFDDIALWAGEGSKQAALAVQWNDSRETHAMVWGYQWEGDAYGIDLIFGVAKADPSFFVMADATTSGYGSAIAGIGYDANGDGVFFVKRKNTGEILYPDENGVIPHPNSYGYDYDNYEAGDPEDYWGAGWYQSYWSYWTGTDVNNLGYSGVGASGRKLTHGCWDGWNFAAGMATRPFKEMVAAPAAGYTSGTFILSSSLQKSILSVLDKKGKPAYDVYGEANPSLSLDAHTYSVSIFGSNMYIVSDNRLIIADAKKLTQQTSLSLTDGRSFVGINEQKAYLGTADGIYIVHTGGTASLGQAVTALGDETGTMLYSKGCVFAIQKNKGILVINAETNTVKKTISGDYLFLAQSPDGTVWAGAGTLLSRINPETLETWNITLPANASLSSDWNDWNARLFFADTRENVLYWVHAGNVFKYEIGQPASIEAPFFSLPNEAGLSFSKAAISMNYPLNQLTVSADITSGPTVGNRVYMVDCRNGDVLNTYSPALEGNTLHIAYPDKPANLSGLAGQYTFAMNANPLVIPFRGNISDPDNLYYNIDKKVTSDNTSLVTAEVTDENLIITPQAGRSGNGQLSFYAISNGAVSKKNIEIAITRSLESISLARKELTMKKGGVDTLDVVFTPADATNKQVSWKSSNTTVASVNATSGSISARNTGETDIIVTSAEGNFTDTCKLTVVNELLTGITLSKHTSTVFVNRRDTIRVHFLPPDASNKSISWSMDEPANIVQRSQYSDYVILTGLNPGTSKLRVTSSDGGFVDSCEVTVVFNPATGFKLNADTVELDAPATFSLAGTFSPSDASNTKITWTSGDAAVATVSTYGMITAVAAGETHIFAQSTDDASLKDSVLVRVGTIHVTGLTFSETAKTVALPKKTYSIPAKTITPSNASNKTILWTSSDEDRATVNTYGIVTLKGLGLVTITGTTQDGGFTAQCELTIVDTIHVTGFALREDQKEVWKKVNNMWYPYNTITPDDATLQTFSMAFEDETVVGLYSPGSTYIKALAPGDSKVFFSTTDGGFVDTCLVHVVDNATSISLGEKEKDLIVGDVFSLRATVLPANAYPFVTWTSSDKTVAEVDENGNVKALKAGATRIIVAGADSPALKDTCELTVRNQIAEEIRLETGSQSLLIGDEWVIKAEVLPENTTNKRLTWKSDDYSIADVNANGVVKALKVGSATITAYSKDGGAQQSCLVSVGEVDYTRGVFFVNEDWFGH